MTAAVAGISNCGGESGLWNAYCLRNAYPMKFCAENITPVTPPGPRESREWRSGGLFSRGGHEAQR